MLCITLKQKLKSYDERIEVTVGDNVLTLRAVAFKGGQFILGFDGDRETFKIRRKIEKDSNGNSVYWTTQDSSLNQGS